MELTRKRKTIKYLCYCAVLLLCALLQNVDSLSLQLGSARCFLLIPAAVLLGINEDEKTAAFLGLFAGMLWDMISARHVGFNCIMLMLLCFASSALVSYVFRNTFITGLLAAVAAVIIYCPLYWLFFVLIKSPDGAGGVFLKFYLPCMVYTAAVAPLLEAALIPIKSKLSGERQLDD